MNFLQLSTKRSVLLGLLLQVYILFFPPIIDMSSAYADSYISLPGGNTSKKLLDGAQVSITLTREHAKLTPSVVAAWTSHQVLLSGMYTVRAPNSAQVQLSAGYLLGCSLEFFAGQYLMDQGDHIMASSGQWYFTPFYPSPETPNLVTPNLQWNPEPGVDIYFGDQDFNWSAVPGTTQFEGLLPNNSSIPIQNGSGGFVYNDTGKIQDACVGYASARAKAILTVTYAGERVNLTLWGKPFSLSS